MVEDALFYGSQDYRSNLIHTRLRFRLVEKARKYLDVRVNLGTIVLSACKYDRSTECVTEVETLVGVFISTFLSVYVSPIEQEKVVHRIDIGANECRHKYFKNGILLVHI